MKEKDINEIIEIKKRLSNKLEQTLIEAKNKIVKTLKSEKLNNVDNDDFDPRFVDANLIKIKNKAKKFDVKTTNCFDSVVNSTKNDISLKKHSGKKKTLSLSTSFSQIYFNKFTNIRLSYDINNIITDVDWLKDPFYYPNNYDVIDKIETPLCMEKSEVICDIPNYLTDYEKKKLQKAIKKEKSDQKRNRVLMGLVEPDKPKIKLNNILRVLGSDAIANPTAAEETAQKEVAERLNKHLERNRERSLTSDEKKQKTIAFWKNVDDQKFLVLYKVRNYSETNLINKISLNAKELHCTGFILYLKSMNNLYIVLQGSERAYRKFVQFFENRLSWFRSNSENSTALIYQCIFKGMIQENIFNSWNVYKMNEVSSLKEVYKFFYEQIEAFT